MTKGDNCISQHLTVKNPELWYPSGCSPKDDESIIKTGKPAFIDNPLYSLSVKASGASVEKKIAFRTLETVSKKDKDGLSLFFKINDRSVFSKGSNWIPLDALPSRQTPERYENLLDSLVKANMNTVRVWGGGMYEKDIFYEICDRKGILIWHDFMFACGLYPTNKEFLDSVRDEVKHQVLRLKDHPSIALWCGNNENLGSLGWYAEAKSNRDLYLIDYDRLNEGVVGDEVRKNDPDRMWWPVPVQVPIILKITGKKIQKETCIIGMYGMEKNLSMRTTPSNRALFQSSGTSLFRHTLPLKRMLQKKI